MNKKDFFTRKLVVFVCAFICCALWGSAIPMIKTGYRILQVTATDSGSQVLFGGFRFTIAGLLVILFACIQEHKLMLPDRQVLKYAPLLCLAQTAGQYTFFYIGVANANGVTGGILSGMGNFFAILMSCLVFRSERMTFRKFLGVLFGFLGVLVINLMGGMESASFHLTGEGFILLAGVCYGLSSSMIREFSRHASAVLLSGYQFFIGGLLMSCIGFAMGGSLQGWNLAAISVLIYLALVSAVAYTLWSILLTYNQVSNVSIYGFINPICSVMLAAVILGEITNAFNLGNLIALALVSAGIFVVNVGTGE